MMKIECGKKGSNSALGVREGLVGVVFQLVPEW